MGAEAILSPYNSSHVHEFFIYAVTAEVSWEWQEPVSH